MNGLLGTAGFAGTWESDSVQVNSVFEFQIEPYEEDGLSFINPAEQTTKNIKFDGKDYPASGPSLPKGFTTSGHRVSALTIQLTDKLAGKIVDTRQVDLSADLKTLTMTVRTMNHNKPNILVFEREERSETQCERLRIDSIETANFDRGDTVTLAIDVIQNPERVLKKIERNWIHLH